MLELIVATTNAAKVAALRRAVGGAATLTGTEHDISQGFLENPAGSFQQIAEAKALSASRALEPGACVIATDGGLYIPALGPSWAPQYTRRFAGPDATDRDRADALLRLGAPLKEDERRIFWREALAVARNGNLVASWTADGPPGLLADDYDPVALARGDGFWLPSLWICPEFGGRRLSDLTPDDQMARRDHWFQLGAWLSELLRSQFGGLA